MTFISRLREWTVTHWRLLALSTATLLIRGALLVARHDQLQQDPDDYLLIAHNLVRAAVFSVEDHFNVDDPTVLVPRPSAYRPPLYPVILSNLAVGEDKTIHRGAIAATHLSLGLATVWLTWWIARALGLAWGSEAAGLLVACDPILLNQQSVIMTETLAAFCTVLAWALLVRFHFDRNGWNAGLAGAALGLAVLCRPTYLPWLGVSSFLCLFLLPGKLDAASKDKQPFHWGFPNRQDWLQILNALAMLMGGIGVISPWVIRNYQAFQKPLVTTTHGGYTLHLANNPHFYRYLREDNSGLPWDPTAQSSWGFNGPRGLHFSQSFQNGRQAAIAYEISQGTIGAGNEFEISKFETEEAWLTMSRDPLGLLRAAVYRVRQLWSPLPHKLAADESRGRTWLRYLTAAWYLGVYVLAIAGCYRLRGQLLRSPWLWGTLLCLIFTGVHTLYWCNLRMRAPLMPIVAVIAAAGAVQGARSFSGARNWFGG